jgi:hypothetical protein
VRKFYLTFGVQYSREPHPRGSHVHPDGYVVITAKDGSAARDIVTQLYGIQWSNLYSEDEFMQDPVTDLYPRGALLNIQVPEDTNVG